MPKRICKYYFNGQEFSEQELKSALLSGYFDSYAQDAGIKLPTMKDVSEKKLKKILSKARVNQSPGSNAMTLALQSLPNLKANTDVDDFNLAISFPEAVQIKNEFGDVVGAYLLGEVYLDPFYLSNTDSLVKGMAYAWMEIAKGKDNALYNAFLNEAKNTQYYKDAKNLYPGASEQQLAQLAASQMIMDDANKLTDDSVKAKISRLISKIGDLMKKLFGIGTNLDFMNMKASDFSKLVAKELMGANPISQITNDQLLKIDTEAPAISINGGIMGASPGYADRLVRMLSGKEKTFISPRYFRSVGQMLNYWFRNNNAIEKLDETKKAQVGANMKLVMSLVNEMRDELKKIAKANNLTDAEAKKLIDDINAMLTSNMMGPTQSALTPELQKIIERMRDQIDAMSSVIQSYVDPNSTLYAVIDNNFGVYMNRSYAAFKDSRWNKKMFPSGMNTKADATSKRELQFQNIYKQAYDFIKSVYPDLSADEVDMFLKKLARVDKGEETFELPKGKLGTAMGDFLKQRKDIAPEIRSFLGEYTDPITNFYHTMENMVRYAENKNFLYSMKDMGMNKIFFEKPSGEFNVLVAKDDSYSPLAGLYTSRDIAEQLKQSEKSMKIMFLRQAATIFKLGKTALYPASIVRNFWSYVLVHFYNGHFNPAKGGLSSFKLAFKELRNRPDETLARLTELGILDDGIYAGELKAAINEAFPDSNIQIGDEEFYNSFTDKMTRFAAKSTKNVLGVYKAVDDVHKIFAYYNELSSVEYMFPNLSKEKQEKLAVERTKQVHVFYNKAPKAVTRLAKSPLLGTFPTFTSEMIRVSIQAPMLALKDIKEGIKNKNGKQVFIGSKRMSGVLFVGTLTASIGGGVIASIVKALGYDDEDDEKRNQLKDATERVLWEGSPEWAKASSRIVLDSPQPGVYTFLDVDWVNPFSIYSRAYNMYNRSGKFDPEANPMYEMFWELGKNFIGEEATLSILLNAYNGIDSKGNPLYSSDADKSEQLSAVIPYMLYEMSPGLIKTVEDIYSAATKLEGYDKQADVKDANEVFVKNAFGFDIKRVDAAKQFKNKVQNVYAENFDSRYKKISSAIYNGDKELGELEFKLKRGDISEAEYNESVTSVKNQISEEIQNSAAKYVGNQVDLNEYVVALYRVGVDPEKIQSMLDQGLRFGTMGGFPKVKFKDIMAGNIESPFELDFNGTLDNRPSMQFKPKDGPSFYALPKSFLESINVTNEAEYIDYLINLNNYQKKEFKEKYK